MANKKTTSKAAQVASSSKKKEAASKNHKEKETKEVQNEQEHKKDIPVRLITSLSALALFVLFGVIFFNPDGAIVNIFYKLLLGMFGKIVFYVSIPALLYLFFIHAFSGKRPVIMRSVCLGVFVLICGVFHEMILLQGTSTKEFVSIGELYSGGIQQTHAGLVCGGVATLLRWLMGNAITYISLVVAGLLTLMGSMQITIPGLVRAFRNRPKAEWEEEEKEPTDPAAVVVNHLANKRIEYMEKRRAELEKQEAEAQKKSNPRADEMMRQIVMDVETPVSAAEKRVSEPDDNSIFVPVGAAPKKKTLEDNIPKDMPSLEMELVAEEPPVAREIPIDFPVDDEEETFEQAPVAEEAPPKVTAKEAAESAAVVAAEIAQNAQVQKPMYCFPPIELLHKPVGGSGESMSEVRENSRRLNETLESFKIDARIINVVQGPSVTRYEVELDKGVRMSKITGIADDIALSLGASGVRIAAVPDKISIVGIEVPNRAVTTVSLREVIDSSAFNKAKSKTSFAVGKDIGGSCIVGNIAKLPHMLIAGTTGSGKSVCMNSIIISLLYKASPEDVKLIMIDPKMVELGIYNAIPHLLIPVVTDPKKAAGSLQWAVTEMMRRYNSMSHAGVRDIESYNSIMIAEEREKLPQVVVIIDELADLMLVAAKEVEESICRIAQMGRAAGIHLIIATQRPSADVITGLMKANIPSRIAFSVASAMESRIILDTMGAEKLVGKGDMLFSPIGSGKPQRVQGCFVSDAEVEAVTSYVKDNYNVSYDKGIMEEIDKKAAQTGSSKPATASDPDPNDAELDGDEMLPAAVDVILETGQASVSMLQRRLKLGYARAARIVDEMEEKGIVGPFQGSKPRAILVTKEQWETMKSGQSTQLGFEDLDDANAPVPDELDF